MEAETRTCRACGSGFRIEADDFGFYERMGALAPGICPDCRFMRRSVWRNERTLYKRVCDLCRSSTISMFSPESPYVLYCHACWYSDKWDPSKYAKDYDPKRPFLEQLQELILSVPKAATYLSTAIGPNINSEYTNFAGGNKDCYLIFNSGPNNENSAYSRGIRYCRDVFDTYFSGSSERMYEGVNVEKSSGIAFGQNVADSLDSWFLLDCVDCQKCFGCVNTRHASNQFFNEQLDKEVWQEKVTPLLGSYASTEALRQKFAEHSLKFPRRENSNLKCVNCTGDYLYECKNCKDCYELQGAEDCKYCFSSRTPKSCYDILGYGLKSEFMLECVGTGVSSNIIGGWSCDGSHDLEYCLAIRGGEYCLGCDGMEKPSYCILNKRYEPEEYEALRTKIVEELKQSGEYGLFFPPRMALFAYNEGVGRDYRPLEKAEALKRGFLWQDNIPQTHGKETLRPEDIPDHIKDISDSILDEILACVKCGRNYKIIKPELEMYRKAQLPVPRRCFNCRHEDRIRRRGPFSLHDRTCDRCSKAIKTSYAPDRPEVVYCEQCYQQEVV